MSGGAVLVTRHRRGSTVFYHIQLLRNHSSQQRSRDGFSSNPIDHAIGLSLMGLEVTIYTTAMPN
jgi:hypothetical protein